MIIDGMEKLTLLDFPGHLACIIFTKGCNFKCPFCQNSPLIDSQKECGKFTEEYVLNYLTKRKGILDGICISGGEPLVQPNIETFIRKVKDIGYKVKLDTNGSNPEKLKKLIDDNLIDYVAMDVKNSFYKYTDTIGKNAVNIKNLKRSIDILKNSSIDYEFRTTIVKEYHTINDIKEICNLIGHNSKYYLQNFVDSENVVKKGLHGFSKEELTNISKILSSDFSNLQIRGI